MSAAPEKEFERRQEPKEFVEHLVSVRRVTKVVKGGKNMSFSALVVIGDQQGRVGYGSGKAKEVPDAIAKAVNSAKQRLIRVPLREGRTLHHNVKARAGAGKVVLRPAPAGTGVIAGGPMRSVFDALGIHDIVAKSLGSANPYNMIKATFAALESMAAPKDVARRRSKKISDIVARRGDKTPEAAAAE